MEQIDSEILELESKLAELKRKRDEEAKKLTINIKKFNPGTQRVQIKLSKFRDDIVNQIRWSPDRLWDSINEINVININSLQNLLDQWYKDPSITIMWDDSFSKYEEWKNRPDCFVEIEGSYVQLTIGPKFNISQYTIQSYLSTISRDNKGYRFAIAEFYQFPPLMDQYRNIKVEYSPEAHSTLINQLELRKQLAELANATDYPMENPFIGIDPKTDKPYDLKPHQRVAIRFTELSGGKAIIAYDMGTGKSAITIGLAERHPEWKKVLIICPANLKTNWKREIKKFTNQDALIFSGTEPDSLDIDAWVDDKRRYYIINYDIIGRSIGEGNDKIMKWVILLNALKPDYISIDECHYIKNMDSKRSIGVRGLNYQNVTPMSGTVLVNRPIELYPNLFIVKPETFNSPAAFLNNFTNGDGTARNVKKLHEMISTYMIRRTRKDIYGDSIFIERIPFIKELSPQARINYTRILQGIYQSLRKPEYRTNVTSIFAELIRCKQTCSADNIQASADLAIDAYDETEKKVIIFSQFKESQYGIQSILGSQSVVVNGDVIDDERYRLMDEFQDKSSKVKYWITNILEGLTLTEAHTVIFNDIWWTPKDHSQAEGRCFGRDNDPHGGNSYWLENENTIDQFLNELLMKKTAVFNQVIDGVRDSQEEQGSIMNALIQHLRSEL